MFSLLVLAFDTAPSHLTFPIYFTLMLEVRNEPNFGFVFLILNENCKCKVFLQSLENIPHFLQRVPKCKSNIL